MNNDLISRSALMKAMEQADKEAIDYEMLVGMYEHLVRNAPTVEPFEPDYVGAERVEARQRGYEDGYHNGMEIGKTLNPKIKQGEWIMIKNSDGNLKCYECSNCGKCQGYISSYCEDCGADMQKGGAE